MRGHRRQQDLSPSTSLVPPSTQYTTMSYRADNEAFVASLCCCSLHPVKYFAERHATCHCFPQPVPHQIQWKSSCPCCEPAYAYSKCYFFYFTEIHTGKTTFIISILQLSFYTLILQLTFLNIHIHRLICAEQYTNNNMALNDIHYFNHTHSHLKTC